MKFYSETLDTMFESVEALQEAEAAAAEKEANKKKASEAKKADAKKVEDAFKNFNKAKTNYNNNVLNLKKQFNEEFNKLRDEMTNLNKKHEADIQAEIKCREAAEAAYKAALDEFIKKHPEGYHMTLKDGDHVVTISSSNTNTSALVESIFKPTSFWEDWMRVFKL